MWKRWRLTAWNEETKKYLEERNARFLQENVKTLETKGRMLIPNIKTNHKLREGLEGVEEWLDDAAYSIIKKNLLPHNVGNLTEKERQELIYVGLEQAKYLAQRLDNGKEDVFMDAMNTIAKYGLNGEMDENGIVKYDIK